MRRRDESGMSLVEVILALVILGMVFTALMAGLATTSRSSTRHREMASADRVLRDYAEATESAAKAACPAAGTFTASYTLPANLAADGFAINAPTPQPCPAVTTTGVVTLTVTLPGGSPVKQLSIKVRSS